MTVVNGAISVPAIDERARVLNVLQMYENGALKGSDSSRPPVLALMCKTVLDIRRLNRNILDRLKERSWHGFDEKHPTIGTEILLRIDDASGIHVELMEWTEEDEQYEDDFSEVGLWMLLPEIE